MKTTELLRTCSVLACAIAGAGCAETTRPNLTPGPEVKVAWTRPKLTPDQEVKVVFDVATRCPVDVVPLDLDSSNTCDKKGCFRAISGKNVVFKAVSKDDGQQVPLDYELQFHPFQKAGLASSKGELRLKTQVEMPDKPKGYRKEFPYNVLSGTCKVLDPQIIVEN